MRKIFIDCGTHLGMGFCKLSSALNINHEWDVYGFEANPIVYDQYVKNIQSGKYPPLVNQNISLENKAVWTSEEGVEFSLRGITEHHFDHIYKDGKDESNPYYSNEWESGLANMASKNHNLSEEEILDMPWDGGSCVSEMKDKITFNPDQDLMYKWHENVKVESVDLSQWIMDNFSKDDYIVIKMDIEGAEYKVLPKMIEDGSIEYINSAYIEWHDWFLPEYKSKTSELMKSLQAANVSIGSWG